MWAWEVCALVHRLTAARAGGQPGVPLRQPGHVPARHLPLLPQEPLQRHGLRRGRRPPGAQCYYVHQNTGVHALQRYSMGSSAPSGGVHQLPCLYPCWMLFFSLLWTVYHYQLKIHFSSNLNCSGMEPAVAVSLHGASGDAKDLHLNMWVWGSSQHWAPRLQELLHLLLSLVEMRRLRPTKPTLSCWWPRRTLENCWWLSLSGRIAASGRRPFC